MISGNKEVVRKVKILLSSRFKQERKEEVSRRRGKWELSKIERVDRVPVDII